MSQNEMEIKSNREQFATQPLLELQTSELNYAEVELAFEELFPTGEFSFQAGSSRILVMRPQGMEIQTIARLTQGENLSQLSPKEKRQSKIESRDANRREERFSHQSPEYKAFVQSGEHAQREAALDQWKTEAIPVWEHGQQEWREQ